MGSLKQGSSMTTEVPAKDAAGTGGETKAPQPPAQQPAPPPPPPPAAKEAYGPVPAPAGYSIPEKVLYRASFEDGAGGWSNVEVVPGGLGESTRCARLIPGKRAERWGVKTKMSSRTVFRFACFIPQEGGAESFQLMCWDETAKDNFRVQYNNLERGKWLVFTARLNDWFAWNRDDKPDGHEFNSISVSPASGTVVFDDIVIYEE